MDIKTLRAINSCIHNAMDVIRSLTWPNYPRDKGEDADLYEMYHKLNSMACAIYDKIDVLEAKNNESKES